MLHEITWKFGLHKKPDRWRCAITLYQKEDGSIWNKLHPIDDEDDLDLFLCYPVPDLPGVYIGNGFNSFDSEFADIRVIASDYIYRDGVKRPSLKEIDWEHFKSWYGVADTIEQVLEYFHAESEDAQRRFVIEVMEIRCEDQPEHGGWRWHKNGPYIGTHTPRSEYLADEVNIESVLMFHLYQVEVVA